MGGESSKLAELLVVVEFVVGQEGMNGRRRLDWGLLVAKGLWVEGVGAVVEHSLGKPRGHGLDAEVAEHGIGFPAAKEHDGVLVNVGA